MNISKCWTDDLARDANMHKYRMWPPLHMESRKSEWKLTHNQKTRRPECVNPRNARAVFGESRRAISAIMAICSAMLIFTRTDVLAEPVTHRRRLGTIACERARAKTARQVGGGRLTRPVRELAGKRNKISQRPTQTEGTSRDKLCFHRGFSQSNCKATSCNSAIPPYNVSQECHPSESGAHGVHIAFGRSSKLGTVNPDGQLLGATIPASRTRGHMWLLQPLPREDSLRNRLARELHPGQPHGLPVPQAAAYHASLTLAQRVLKVLALDLMRAVDTGTATVRQVAIVPQLSAKLMTTEVCILGVLRLNHLANILA